MTILRADFGQVIFQSSKSDPLSYPSMKQGIEVRSIRRPTKQVDEDAGPN